LIGSRQLTRLLGAEQLTVKELSVAKLELMEGEVLGKAYDSV